MEVDRVVFGGLKSIRRTTGWNPLMEERCCQVYGKHTNILELKPASQSLRLRPRKHTNLEKGTSGAYWRPKTNVALETLAKPAEKAPKFKIRAPGFGICTTGEANIFLPTVRYRVTEAMLPWKGPSGKGRLGRKASRIGNCSKSWNELWWSFRKGEH